MAPKWANSLRFSAELPSIRLHSQLSLSLGKKRESRVPGLYSDANCKVSCCPDSLQDKQGSVACAGDAHRASDINVTEVLCQVKKQMSIPGLD